MGRYVSRHCVMLPEGAQLPGGWSVEGNSLVRSSDGMRLPLVLTSHRDQTTRRDVRCRFVRAQREQYLAARDPAPKPDLVLALGELLRDGAPAYRAQVLARASRASPQERAEHYRRIGDLELALEAHGRRMRAFEAAGRPARTPRRDRARPRTRLASPRPPSRRSPVRRPATSDRRASARTPMAGASPPAPASAPDPDAAPVPRRSNPGISRAPLLAITAAIPLALLPPREPSLVPCRPTPPGPRSGHRACHPAHATLRKETPQ